ncbi:MAG: hypothetical protein FWH10_02830 [Oscillospiraceae bacterium]|nr:hypothetical protein [Oscillospiraceae bacterium]
MKKLDKHGEVLKKYITDTYGSLAKFSRKESFSRQRLQIILEKKDVFHELSIGVRVCAYLNIDASSLFCENIITPALKNAEETPDKNVPAALPLNDRIKENYFELDGAQRQKVLDYADYIFENENAEL